MGVSRRRCAPLCWLQEQPESLPDRPLSQSELPAAEEESDTLLVCRSCVGASLQAAHQCPLRRESALLCNQNQLSFNCQVTASVGGVQLATGITYEQPCV